MSFERCVNVDQPFKDDQLLIRKYNHLNGLSRENILIKCMIHGPRATIDMYIQVQSKDVFLIHYFSFILIENQTFYLIDPEISDSGSLDTQEELFYYSMCLVPMVFHYIIDICLFFLMAFKGHNCR